MAKYEQICKGDSKGTKKYAKYCKRRAVRAADKRIVTAYVQGYEKRALRDTKSHKSMAGWTN